jgi:hypothetical protein
VSRYLDFLAYLFQNITGTGRPFAFPAFVFQPSEPKKAGGPHPQEKDFRSFPYGDDVKNFGSPGVTSSMPARGSRIFPGRRFLLNLWSQLTRVFDNAHIDRIINNGTLAAKERAGGGQIQPGIIHNQLVPRTGIPVKPNPHLS